VIALRAGGALDIVQPGETGWLLDGQKVEELRGAIGHAAAEELDPAAIRASAERFGRERFRRELRAEVEELVAARQRRRSRQ
jgi:glycosyltransferase involved in cell wall biosynthesis